MSGTVKGIYAHLDCLIDTIDALKKAGHKDFIVTSPFPRHEILDLIYEGKPSPVRWFTMTGAILGGISGFALASLTHLNWPMIIPAGKPLVSIPAFLIITFEATVLWGCMFTLLGLLICCGLPALRTQQELDDPRLSDDKFGVVVNGVTGPTAQEVRTLLESNGAIEVTGEEASNA